MANTITLTVVGMKAFKGTVDGKHYDSTRWFVEAKLSGENSRGVSTQDFVCGTSTVYDVYQNITLPAEFDFDFEMQTNGKQSKITYTGVRVKGGKNDPTKTDKAAF